MDELIGAKMAIAKLKDGTEVEIRSDKHHFRAYNAEMQQVGPTRVVLGGLLTEIGGTLVMEQGSGENTAGGRDKSVLEREEQHPDALPVPVATPGAMPGPEVTVEQLAPHAGPAGGLPEPLGGEAAMMGINTADMPAKQMDEQTGEPSER